MLQLVKGVSNIIAVANMIPQHTHFLTELSLTSQMPNAGRDQEFRATSKLSKMAKKSRSVATGPLYGQPLKTEQLAT